MSLPLEPTQGSPKLPRLEFEKSEVEEETKEGQYGKTTPNQNLATVGSTSQLEGPPQHQKIEVKVEKQEPDSLGLGLTWNHFPFRNTTNEMTPDPNLPFLKQMEKFDFLMFLNKLYFNYFSALTKNLHRNMMHFEQQQAWSNYCYSIMQMSHMIAPPSASRRREEQRVGMPLKKEEPIGTMLCKQESIPDPLSSFPGFFKIDISTILSPHPKPPQPISLETLNSLLLQETSPMNLFLLMFPEEVIRNLCFTPPERFPLFASCGTMKKYLGFRFWREVIRGRRIPGVRPKIIKHAAAIKAKHLKLHRRFKRIRQKFKDISLKNFITQHDKVKSIIEKVNVALSQLYKPANELYLVRKILFFADNSQLRFLLLFDARTDFLVRMGLESFHSSRLVQDIEDMVEGFSRKGYSIYIPKRLTSLELLSKLRLKDIQAFGLAENTKPASEGECEVFSNRDNLHICFLQNQTLLTNMSAMQLKNEGLVGRQEALTFFLGQANKITGIKSSQRSGGRHMLKELYQEFLMMLFDIAANNAFIVSSKCLQGARNPLETLKELNPKGVDKRGKKKSRQETSHQTENPSNIMDFEMNIFECLLGIRTYTSNPSLLKDALRL